MKNTQIEFENLAKHLDESFSNISSIPLDELLNADGDESSNAEGDEYSNARGGGGGRRGGGGMRMGGGGRIAMPRPTISSPRISTPTVTPTSTPTSRHRNYVRRNYYGGGWGYGWGYPYAVGVYPPVAYYYDAENPKTIKITKAGLQYLKKQAKGVHAYFLNAIKDGNSYNETKLKDSLQLSDFERLMSWMHGNKFIDFV